MNGKIKKWWVASINCDCASYVWARVSPFHGNHDIRCRSCGKLIGIFSASSIERVQALTESDAEKAYGEILHQRILKQSSD